MMTGTSLRLAQPAADLEPVDARAASGRARPGRRGSSRIDAQRRSRRRAASPTSWPRGAQVGHHHLADGGVVVDDEHPGHRLLLRVDRAAPSDVATATPTTVSAASTHPAEPRSGGRAGWGCPAGRRSGRAPGPPAASPSRAPRARPRPAPGAGRRQQPARGQRRRSSTSGREHAVVQHHAAGEPEPRRPRGSSQPRSSSRPRAVHRRRRRRAAPTQRSRAITRSPPAG